MSYPTDSFSTNNLRSAHAGNPKFKLGLAGFVAGVAVMGGIWWIGIGPQRVMSVYWLTGSGNSVHYVQQERSFRAGSSEQAIQASLQQLIDGPGNPQLISAVPNNTRILGVKIDAEHIFLDFSPEFAAGGGTTTMLGRVKQVLYTVTSQNERAKVWISINGKALDVLSGDGVILEQPLTRNSYDLKPDTVDPSAVDPSAVDPSTVDPNAKPATQP